MDVRAPVTVAPPLAVINPVDAKVPPTDAFPETDKAPVIVAPLLAVTKPVDENVPLIVVLPVTAKAFVPGLVYDPTASLVMAPYASPTEIVGATASVPPNWKLFAPVLALADLPSRRLFRWTGLPN